MHPSLTLHRIVGAGVFLVTLILYMMTMAPTVSFWDTGEFIACSYILGVPHPPGSPLYVLLGRVFSMVPVAEVASRVVFMSVLASACAVTFTYFSAVTLARRAMGGEALRPFGDGRDWAAALGSAVAALCLATSYTFWFNGTEAEVYAYSLFFVCGGMWLAFHWEGTRHGAGNDRWLFFIAYFFGLGGGLHLLCLLTIPALLILAWFGDRGLRRLILIGAGAGLQGLVILSAFAENPPSARLLALLAAAAALLFYAYIWKTHEHLQQTVKYLAGAGFAVLIMRGGFESGLPVQLALAAGAAAVLYHLFKADRRALGLLLGTIILFALGYSTYLTLLIRSGLDPGIDMNNPENLTNFISFLNREQYGTDSQLLGMLQANSSRTYQLWHQQMKYFFQQWPFFLDLPATFRWATEDAPHVIYISVVPLIAGIGGMVWHGARDWRRFLAVMVMFMIMGLGLSFYLNMPDPQPRERHYVFGGMFLAWALWMGLGWTALVDAVRQWFKLPTNAVAALSVVGLLLPAGVGAKLYHQMDRSGDYIAHDYAYNLLQSCDPNSLLFTNGDNDTFPLWYLQEVEGIRRDVRIVNLSLLNTGWYIKQLRDREPKVAMARPGQPELTDTYIDSTLCDTQLVDLYKRVWREPKTPYEFTQMGFDDVTVTAQPGHDLLRIQDIMSIGIVYWNNWKRPIHYAITVSPNSRVGLDPYLEMQGMTMKLMRERVTSPTGIDAMARNLFEVYRFRGINDPDVYKDVNTSRLLGNYRACVMSLAEAYKQEGRLDELAHLFRWADETIDLGWQGLYTASEHYRDAGRPELAVEFLHRAGLVLVDEYGRHPSATYENGLALGSILLNTHRAVNEAEEVYRAAIALHPERFDGVHELAATLQAAGRTDEALQVVEDYIARYGETPGAAQDRQVLRNALSKQAGEGLESASALPGTEPSGAADTSGE